MATNRLNGEIRNKIMQQLLDRRFKEDIEQLRHSMDEVADLLYNSIYPPPVQRKMKALPKGWLGCSQRMWVNIGGQRSYWSFSGSLSSHTYSLSRACNITMMEKRLLPSREQEERLFTYNDLDTLLVVDQSTDAAKAALNFQKLLAKTQEQISEVSANAYAAMSSVTTVKKLIDDWPEIEEFAKPHLDAVNRQLPVVARKKLNQQLRLP